MDFSEERIQVLNHPTDIIGNRVILRNMEEQDREMLMNLIRDREVSKVTKGYPHPISYEHQINWFRSVPVFAGDLHRIIAHKENPRIGLGIILLSHMNPENKTAKIYIKLMKSARQKGYGQDAVNVLVSYAFHELGLNCIDCDIMEYNEASRRLFEKCGFKQEGVQKRRAYEEEHCRNVCLYEIKNKKE